MPPGCRSSCCAMAMPAPTPNRLAPRSSSTISPTCPRRWSGSVSLHQLEVDAAALNFGEIAVNDTELRLHLHPHRDHHAGIGDQPRVPDCPLPRAFAALPSLPRGRDFAAHPTDDRGALEALAG